MPREELEAKFRGNAGLFLPEEKIEQIIRDVGGMAAGGQLTSLMKSLLR